MRNKTDYKKSNSFHFLSVLYSRRKPRYTYEKLRNFDNRRGTRRNSGDRYIKALQRRAFIAAVRLPLPVPPERKTKEKTLFGMLL